MRDHNSFKAALLQIERNIVWCRWEELSYSATSVCEVPRDMGELLTFELVYKFSLNVCFVTARILISMWNLGEEGDLSLLVSNLEGKEKISAETNSKTVCPLPCSITEPESVLNHVKKRPTHCS